MDYTLLNESIPRVKYLGVTITHDLKWNTQCKLTTQKANRTLGLLRRTLSPCTKNIKSKAYTMLVRPQLEYGSEAWNPRTLTSIQSLDKVQRAAADYRRVTSVTALVNKLGWDTLHNRRLLAQSTLFYKMHHHQLNMPFPTHIIPATYLGRNDHPLKYAVPPASIDSFKYSFYPRTIWTWNHLSAAAVTSPTVTIFQEAALPIIRALPPPVGSKLL